MQLKEEILSNRIGEGSNIISIAVHDIFHSALGQYTKGCFTGNDTVYFCTADVDGNACSFINSNYMGFGTALVPRGCGFSLHVSKL